MDVRVLLVDDDRQFRSALRRLLISGGVAVDDCETPDTFLEAVAKNAHDVLLIDWNLRVGLGTDLCVRLRAAGECRPIALMSALLDGSFGARQAASAGANAYIDKVCEAQSWAERLTTLARGQREAHTLDHASHLFLCDGCAVFRDYRIPLRRKEYELLRFLLSRANTTVTQDTLIEQVWREPLARNEASAFSQRARIATTVNRLRAALGRAAHIIETTPNGYLVRTDGSCWARVIIDDKGGLRRSK